MAITKIMHMKSAEHGNVSAHLKHSLAYICNEAKTENGSLVGSINCLPDYAYEQMVGTKEMFGQTGGRQGYHFIISLKPGEGTKEQMYDIVQRFAKEFLGDEYEAEFAVHTDQKHLHAHLVFNSVSMITGRKYDYRKGDWKDIIQPITNRLCQEYGLSIVAAEYSKDPVNMNRKQWEKEQSWKDFITGDMQYCRSKAESFEEFIFLMEKLGYEVKVGANISVKANGMRRSRRLDTLDEEFSLQNLQEYYEQPHSYKYVTLPVYQPGYALMRKPKNAFQQRYYGKMYRMCVVQKYRFQYKYTRYQQDLIRMKELQEEYLFLNREGINGWNDVFAAKHKAERKIADIDAKKKELYNEHARYKYQYEKDGDATVYLYHEAHYREQLEELKEKRKEAKSELNTINRCLKESTYAHLEIPDDVDIENLYVVDVPEFKEKPSYDSLYESYEEESLAGIETVIEAHEAEMQTEAEVSVVESEEPMLDYGIWEREPEYATHPMEAEPDLTVDALEEKEEPISKERISEPVDVRNSESFQEPDTEERYSQLYEPVMTKEIYLSLTDKEKVEWLGLMDCELSEAIVRFGEKMKGIGIVYKYGDDMLDDFMRLESVAKQMKKERITEQEFVVQREIETKGKSR